MGSTKKVAAFLCLALAFFLARGAGALGLVKLDSPDPVTTGSDLTYTLTATNDTATELGQADLSDPLPTGTTFVSLSAPAGWTCSTPAVGSTGTVSCSAAPFAVGDSVLTLVVHVALSVAAATNLDNQADLTVTDGGRSTELSATASTLVLSPTTLTATKTIAGGTAPGSSLTYTVVLTNTSAHNQGDYAGDEFTDTLPSGLALTSASATSGTATATIATNTVTWNGSLGAGASVTITIQATIVAGPGTTVSNQGTVAYDADGNGTNEAAAPTDDPMTAPVDDATSFAVLSPATLTATKTASADHATTHALTYTVVVTNQGPQTQFDNPGDEFTDVLPAGVALLSASATSGTVTATTASNTVTWNGSLGPGASVTITIEATITADPGTTVSNQGTLAYDADGDGSNEAAGVTDDPGVGGAADPTTFVVAAQPTVEVPTASGFGLGALALLLVLAGGAMLRHRS